MPQASAACPSVAGDLNGSGAADVVDVQCGVVAALWSLAGSSGELPSCLAGGLEAADSNCDETVDVIDVLLIIQLSLGEALSGLVDADSNGCPDACQDDPGGSIQLKQGGFVPFGGTGLQSETHTLDALSPGWVGGSAASETFEAQPGLTP